MLGFIIGTACLIGLIKTLRGGACGGYGRRAYGYGYGGACGKWGGGAPPYWSGYSGEGPSGYEGGPGHGHGGPFRTHGRAWGGWRGGGIKAFFLRRLFEELDTTPGQEKVISQALEELREAVRQQRGEVQKTRADIAKAMRSPSFDEVLLGELFARHDAALEAIRKAIVGSLAKVHEALDERQRARLADWIERNPGFWGPFGGQGVEI